MKASVSAEATLEDVFARYGGGTFTEGGTITKSARLAEPFIAWADRSPIAAFAQSILFGAIFYGIAVIWERDLGIVRGASVFGIGTDATIVVVAFLILLGIAE